MKTKKKTITEDAFPELRATAIAVKALGKAAIYLQMMIALDGVDVRRISTTELAARYDVSQSTAARVKRSLSLTKSAVVVASDGRKMRVRKIGRRRADPFGVERDEKGYPEDLAIRHAEQRILKAAERIRKARARGRHEARMDRIDRLDEWQAERMMMGDPMVSPDTATPRARALLVEMKAKK